MYERIDPIGTSDDRERKPKVFDKACHRADRCERVQAAESPGDYVARARDPTGGGLEARKTAERRRDADAAAGVGAEVHRRAAGSDDRSGPAAASAGSPANVIWVVGLAIDQVVSLERER